MNEGIEKSRGSLDKPLPSKDQESNYSRVKNTELLAEDSLYDDNLTVIEDLKISNDPLTEQSKSEANNFRKKILEKVNSINELCGETFVANQMYGLSKKAIDVAGGGILEEERTKKKVSATNEMQSALFITNCSI